MGSLSCGLVYKTDQPVKKMEAWMKYNCDGDWDIRLAGMDDKNPAKIKKILEIYFERKKDKEKFKKAFSDT